MQKRLDKKAQQLSTTTLILLVLGIIILVLVIIGLSIGFGNLTDKINIFAGSNTLSDIVLACKIDAAANAKISYCNSERPVKLGGEKINIKCSDPRVSDLLDPAEKIDCTNLATTTPTTTPTPTTNPNP